MKIVQINASCGLGSTGKICVGISKLLTESSIENYILYSYGNSDYPLGIKCASLLYIKIQALKSRVLGNYGFNSLLETLLIIKHLKRINPDIVHLHNIHGHDCNLDILLKFIKRNRIKVVWTFHDCWAFTAYCPYFLFEKCSKWQSECSDCPVFRTKSWLFDRSKYLFKRKKDAMSGLDLTIITPSHWLADTVKASFLKNYPVHVIGNGIDLDTFKPTPSRFREKHNIPQSKYMVLGVAFDWDNRKGLDVFVELASRLDHEQYQIVLVGTNQHIDARLPKNIITIHRTQNQNELAAIYTAADVFVNPTREDNYPTVNMESLACGTPIITTNDSGGSAEIIDFLTGDAVRADDIRALEVKIVQACTSNVYTVDNCLLKAQSFNQQEKYKEYLSLYKNI